MSRQAMFDMEANSIDLVRADGLQIKVENPESCRELSAHEKKEYDRKKRAGKVGRNFFNNAQMTSNNDVIASGSGFSTIQKQEEQTVEIKNFTEEACIALKSKYLLTRFDKGGMLSKKLQETVMSRFREGPTVIQQYVVPLILYTDRDIVARAKTGSGKSAAFILPLIELIHRSKMEEPEEMRKRVNSSAPYAIIFEPTRELCVQLAREVNRLAEGTNVKVTVSFGTMDMATSYQLARSGADIVVGTPSRINHLFFGIEGNEIHKPCFDFNNLKYIVLDEADRMVDQAEFATYSLPFKERLTNSKVRVFMFSATDGDCETGKQMFITNPIEIVVGGDEAPVSNIVQKFVKYDPTSTNIVRYKRSEVDCSVTKMDYLVFLLERYVTEIDEKGFKRVPTTIVFVQNKRSSDSVAIWLLRRGFRATALNSDRDMKTRLQAVTGIQSGHYDIVVATDVLARGINIPGVKTVINYELPVQSPVNYVHRIGRTARMGNIGRVISFYDTVKNTNLAPQLEEWLTNSKQQVPVFLKEISFDMTNKMEKRVMAPSNQPINGIPMQRTILKPGMEY